MIVRYIHCFELILNILAKYDKLYLQSGHQYYCHSETDRKSAVECNKLQMHILQYIQ